MVASDSDVPLPAVWRPLLAAAAGGTLALSVSLHCGSRLRRVMGSIARAMLVLMLTVATALGSPIEPGAIEVVDGDTIRAGGRTFRLVGFDTPEMGSRSRCESGRTLAAAASRRLRHLIAGGGLDFERVACSCRPGTEGTPACNHGRLCGTLSARGHDVGAILISEGLARPFVCGPRSCPPQQAWCADPR
jgi:endonuclease YncB( thermonuclease family)